MKCYTLYNPVAGSGISKDDVEALSVAYNIDMIHQDITQIDDYTSLFSALDPDDVVIICGGDGTLNHFINDTEGIDIPCELRYHAVGTGNDFLHDLSKEKWGEPFRINEYISDLPVVEVNGKKRRFLNNVGFGIDGYCCEIGDKLKEKTDKSVNYTAIAIKGLLFHYKPTGATVTIDGKEFRYEKVWLAPTMKGRYYGGGMMPTPMQDRSDPSRELSLMVFYGKGKLKTLMAFPSIFKGEHIKHTNMVAIHKGKEIRVVFDRPTALQIDGETVLGVTEYCATSKVKKPISQCV